MIPPWEVINTKTIKQFTKTTKTSMNYKFPVLYWMILRKKNSNQFAAFSTMQNHFFLLKSALTWFHFTKFSVEVKKKTNSSDNKIGHWVITRTIEWIKQCFAWCRKNYVFKFHIVYTWRIIHNWSWHVVEREEVFNSPEISGKVFIYSTYI